MTEDKIIHRMQMRVKRRMEVFLGNPCTPAEFHGELSRVLKEEAESAQRHLETYRNRE